MSWKVESRRACKICGKEITAHRARTFCSRECRVKSYAVKYNESRTAWHRAKRDEQARKADPRKVQCLICGKFYVQVGTHIVQRHGITAREYREEYELPVKRGIVPKWYRELKGEQAVERGGAENLKAGKKYWYKKGDKRARKNTFYKGQAAKANKLSQEIYPH